MADETSATPAPAPVSAPASTPPVESGAAAQPPTGDSAAGAQVPPGEDYKTRFTGIKALYDNKVGELSALQAKFDALAAELEKLKTEKATEQGKATKAQNELKALLDQVAGLQAENDRLRAVLEQPDLIPMLFTRNDKGEMGPSALLRQDLTGEDFRRYLAEIGKLRETLTKTAVQQHVAGAAPPAAAPRAEPQRDLVQLRDWLLKNPGHADYNQRYQEYLDLLDSQ